MVHCRCIDPVEASAKAHRATVRSEGDVAQMKDQDEMRRSTEALLFFGT